MLEFNSVENIKLTSQIFLKPEYAIHPTVSGNKIRKLKYNLDKFKKENYQGILTFGGAFSNHIAATAAAGNTLGIPTIGVIRGMEVSAKIGSNRTLSYAQKYGMKLEFISRAEYKLKTEKSYLASLESKYPNYYIIPEGGTNRLAVKGCEEILADEDRQYDVICCAVGTGGTLSGIINSSLPHQKIIGFPALKGAFLKQDICKFAKQSNWDLCQDYHFGGYAKVHLNLIKFINRFKREFKIPLDPIYTGKMLFGVFDMMDKGMFSKSQKVLAIHTGGLQGIEGMNQKLRKNNLDLMV
jgi:1-aminocyclopropane-1-carboxylate deaminase